MGQGKGNIEFFVARVPAGRVMFKMLGGSRLTWNQLMTLPVGEWTTLKCLELFGFVDFAECLDIFLVQPFGTHFYDLRQGFRRSIPYQVLGNLSSNVMWCYLYYFSLRAWLLGWSWMVQRISLCHLFNNWWSFHLLDPRGYNPNLAAFREIADQKLWPATSFYNWWNLIAITRAQIADLLGIPLAAHYIHIMCILA